VRATTQDFALTVPAILRRAVDLFGDRELVAGAHDGTRRLTWAELVERVAQVVGALDELGVPLGAPVATLAFNSQEHLELYLGVPAGGRVLHPLNPRLHAADLVRLIRQADERVLFVERGLVSIAEQLSAADQLSTIVVLDDGTHTALGELGSEVSVLDYEQLLDRATPGKLRVEDERTGAALVSTTGTTGDPRTVVHSHRSIFLQTLSMATSDSLGVGESDIVLGAAPFFHANGLNLPFAAAAHGAGLVVPGPLRSPAQTVALIEEHGVTTTITTSFMLQEMLPHLRRADLSALRRVLVGSSPCPPSLLSECRGLLGPGVMRQTFGMTEVLPPALIARPRPSPGSLDQERWAELDATIGVPPFGVERRVVAEGASVPGDGETVGELQLRGPWVADSYLGEQARATDDHGWLPTGDAAVVQPDGNIRLVDRLKDMIKSGGLWISSVQLEGLLRELPGCVDVAVIGRPDARWGERPVAVIVADDGVQIDRSDLEKALAPTVARWAVPDEVLLVLRQQVLALARGGDSAP
jgi:fatty-acyl-CoA synthase